MSVAPDSDGSQLFDFADQLLGDIEAGRELPLAHYLARFPGHEEHVAREYLALTGKGPAESEPVLRRTHPRDRIGPYRLVQVLGRGGQGVVYRAEDTRIERTVALKVLSLPVASVGQGRRNRFRREAEVLSRLDHPGVCTVLDADLEGDTPYIAMRFVEGETLAAALSRARDAQAMHADERETPATDASTSASRLLAPRRALELAETLGFFERAARALHAAHEAGVIHRDVKPGNIMVTKTGLPVLLDFGLARAEIEESAMMTRADEVFGTPAYLSPEQARSGRDVDRRTDVYSLGVVLQECLTLERPTGADASGSTSHALRAESTASLRRTHPLLPEDLIVVLETATERDVDRRYPNALELAEELRRVRVYEPIRARPAGMLLRTQRWAQRNPVVATAVIGSILALSSALVVALVLLGRVNHEKTQKESALHLYEGGWYRDQATSLVPYSPPQALRYAIAAAERDPGLASNRALLAALDATYLQQVLLGHTEMVSQVDVDSSSTLLVSAAMDGTARLWNARTGAAVKTVDTHAGALWAARFSPDGTRFAVGGSGGFCCIASIDPADERVLRLAGHAEDVQSIDFSPDGTRVVTTSRDRTARIFDTQSGAELSRLAGHTGNVSAARFFDEGRLIVTRSADPIEGGSAVENDATARIWDARTGATLYTLPDHQRRAINRIAFSPDGDQLSTIAYDDALRVFRASDGELLRYSRGTLRQMFGMRWSPDSSMIVTWARTPVIEVWYGRDRPFLQVLRGHEGAVRTAAFDPAGDVALTASADGTARTWNAHTGALIRVLDPIAVGRSRVPLVGATFDPAGERIATTDESGTVIVWRVSDAVPLATLEGGKDQEIPARFSGDGKRLAITEKPGCVLIVDLESGRSRRLHAHPQRVSCVRFTPGGDRLMTGGDDRTVCLWDATIPPGTDAITDTDTPVWRSEPFETSLYRLKHVFDVELSRNGRWVVAACENNALQLLDARDGHQLDMVTCATPGRLAFDFEQDLFMVSSKYSSTAALYRIAESAGGAKLVKKPVAHGAGLHHQNSMTSLAAAARAHMSVTTSLDRAARLWNLESYDCLACYVGHEGAVLDGDIDRDATMIVTGSADGTARLWPCDLLGTAKRFEPESLRQLIGPLLVPTERGAAEMPR